MCFGHVHWTVEKESRREGIFCECVFVCAVIFFPFIRASLLIHSFRPNGKKNTTQKPMKKKNERKKNVAWTERPNFFRCRCRRCWYYCSAAYLENWRMWECESDKKEFEWVLIGLFLFFFFFWIVVVVVAAAVSVDVMQQWRTIRCNRSRILPYSVSFRFAFRFVFGKGDFRVNLHFMAAKGKFESDLKIPHHFLCVPVLHWLDTLLWGPRMSEASALVGERMQTSERWHLLKIETR